MFTQFQEALASGEMQSIVTSTIGQIILGILCLILLLGVLIIGNRGKKFDTKEFTYTAIAIAIASALSLIKMFQLPQGGSITPFSMLFVALIGYWFGVKQGITAGIVYGMIQLMLNPYVVHPLQLLLDYPLAYAALGLTGLFKSSEDGIIKGMVIGCFGRFFFHFLSGFIFFAEYAPEGYSPMTYSLTYNISYIGVELFLTILVLLIPALNKALKTVRMQAVK